MRGFLLLVVLSFPMLAAPKPMAAQTGCADPGQSIYYRYRCSNSAGCHNIIGILYEEGIGTEAWMTQVVSCCNVNFTVDVPVGQCLSLPLRNSKTRDLLLAMSQEERILVADCKGRYKPIAEALGTLAVVEHGSGLPLREGGSQ
jgi:hypothetical protein